MVRQRPFKNELIAFREALYRPRVPGSRGRDGLGSSNSADREHLVRWEHDLRTEEIWAKFKAHNPTTSPREFISRGPNARRNAQSLLARISHSKDWPKQLHRHYAERATNIFAQHKSLSDATAEMGVLFYEMCDAVVALELSSFDLPVELPFGRQNKTRKRDDKTQEDNNWRVRRLCVVELSTFWHQRCNRWDDAEVAALVEIAFPGVEITAEQVRNVRRSVKATGELNRETGRRVHHREQADTV
jgi:hypothetical protein